MAVPPPEPGVPGIPGAPGGPGGPSSPASPGIPGGPGGPGVVETPSMASKISLMMVLVSSALPWTTSWTSIKESTMRLSLWARDLTVPWRWSKLPCTAWTSRRPNRAGIGRGLRPGPGTLTSPEHLVDHVPRHHVRELLDRRLEESTLELWDRA